MGLVTLFYAAAGKPKATYPKDVNRMAER